MKLLVAQIGRARGCSEPPSGDIVSPVSTFGRYTKYSLAMVDKRSLQEIEAPEQQMPEDLRRARERCLTILGEYQDRRVNYYENDISLKKIMAKDIAMFSARGVSNSDEYVEEAFHAVESSSEETVMGTQWQRILSAISEDTLDTGDLTTQRDGILWVCEVKAQTNTTNSSSFPQELRGMRTRMQELQGRQRASKQPVKAAYCVLRDKSNKNQGVNETRVYQSPELQRENRDLDNFEYRYITGKQFWQWLTGFDSEIAILMPLKDLEDKGERVKLARNAALVKLQKQLRDELGELGLGVSIDDVVKYRSLKL
ncbi:PmeII family type II restriction endonuclease [Corynebacterium flavescens]|uniref:PmeII family type II restriction endonuclease n=1 Tax=Corynebacterium flavescens TaxID=28028 RepID=UPI00264739FE|nr:PmeII family type II restriction endonuclease [Corynebacterium flavescens]MDN6822935.1 hypothetical protein [Corynebacterium flavescens]